MFYKKIPPKKIGGLFYSFYPDYFNLKTGYQSIENLPKTNHRLGSSNE